QLQKFAKAVGLFKQHKWEEAKSAYEDFLQIRPPYDFKVFEGLRKEGEESLRFINDRMLDIQLDGRVEKVDTLITQNKLEEAQKEVDEILRRNDNHPGGLAKKEEIQERKKATMATVIPRATEVPVPAAPTPTSVPAASGKSTRMIAIGIIGVLAIVGAY